MSPISETSFEGWKSEPSKDPEYVAAAVELEPGYQIARLRIQQGLSQAQLAEKVGIRQSSIAKIEGGNYVPGLAILRRIAEALDARIEIRVIPNDACKTKRK
jgi:transcriptional regulator with XRE-family HTH domain